MGNSREFHYKGEVYWAMGLWVSSMGWVVARLVHGLIAFFYIYIRYVGGLLTHCQCVMRFEFETTDLQVKALSTVLVNFFCQYSKTRSWQHNKNALIISLNRPRGCRLN